MALEYKSSYEEQYCAWGRNSSEHLESARALENGLVKLKASVTENSLRILSVGTGDGHFDLMLLKNIINVVGENVKVSYHCVDPNEIFNSKFKMDISKPESAFLKNVSFDFFPQKFEDFLAIWDTNKIHYQLVIFSHAMSVMSDKGETLTKVARDLLTNDGFCTLFEVTENETSQKFINAMNKDVYCGCGELGQEEMTFEDFMGETVQQLPERLGYKHEKNIFDAGVDVTLCFDAQSLDGNLILDFVVGKENSRKHISAEVMQKILELLQKFCKEKDGRKILKSEIVAVTVGKQ